MPELAEVEIMGRNLRRWLAGTAVVALDVARPATVRGATTALEEALLGRREVAVHRRGKLLLLEAPQARHGVAVRFGMTGKVVLEGPGAPREGARLRLRLGTAASIAFLDARNLGSFSPVERDAPSHALLERLVPGPDALTHAWTGAELARAAAGQRRAVKVMLMDQDVIGGIGNILATEILFMARIHPGEPAGSVDGAAWDRIAGAIPRVIGSILEGEDGPEIAYVNEAGSPNPFAVYGRAGAPCPACGAPLARLRLGGRGSVLCPRCQAPRAAVAEGRTGPGA